MYIARVCVFNTYICVYRYFFHHVLPRRSIYKIYNIKKKEKISLYTYVLPRRASLSQMKRTKKIGEKNRTSLFLPRRLQYVCVYVCVCVCVCVCVYIYIYIYISCSVYILPPHFANENTFYFLENFFFMGKFCTLRFGRHFIQKFYKNFSFQIFLFKFCTLRFWGHLLRFSGTPNPGIKNCRDSQFMIQGLWFMV